MPVVVMSPAMAVIRIYVVGNGEEQWYLPKMSELRTVRYGLRRNAKHQGRKYTSGKISTEGLVSFVHGRIEAR